MLIRMFEEQIIILELKACILSLLIIRELVCILFCLEFKILAYIPLDAGQHGIKTY